MNSAIIIKKLHISISEELFNDLREYRMLKDIDNIVGMLLTEKINGMKIGEKHGRDT